MAKACGLNARQMRFIQEYLIDLSATQAAIRAGYSAKTAGQIGERLLKKVEISDAIAVVMKERSLRTGITADRVLEELARIAFLDIGKAFDEGGNLKRLNEMDEDTRRAIAGLEVTAFHHEGIKIGTLAKLKLADKLSALDKLGKHIGLFDQKVTVDATANGVSLLVQACQGSYFKPVAKPAGEDEDDVAA